LLKFFPVQKISLVFFSLFNQKVRKKLKRYIILITFTIFLSNCTTEKNTFVTRSYHNVTSKFNIIFNGRESFRKGKDYVAENFEDDYTDILPIFKYGDEDIASSISGNMDRTLDKGSKVITFHSIKVKPERKRGFVTQKEQEFYNKKEYNKWMDDNYLLMGKAHFYKMDYMLAMETFRFILSEFPNEEETNNTTYIWMARTHVQQKEFREAEDILEKLSNQVNLTKEQQGELLVTYADFYLKQDDYEKAIDYLQQSLDYIKYKDRKVRYTFILAQLNLRLENYVKASSLFDEVIKMNPPYEMTFNAKINRALAFEGGSDTGHEIKEQLNNMLKDDKNIDYQDQIYYALGVIALKEGKREEAMDFLKKSANVSVSNDMQKAKSYLALAELYYEEPDYMNAQAYYDSTSQFIDPDFPNYQEVQARASSLGNLVTNLRIADREDSLQRIASMPESEQMAFIDRLIDQVREEEQLAREREQQRQNDMRFNQNQSQGFNNTAASGKWYFYNPSAKSLGQPEFRMKWGNRKLEDNWRRRNKSSNFESLANEESMPTGATTGEQQITDNKTREFYLQHLPITDSAMEISDKRIQESLYNAGMIYRDELHDQEKATETFEELINKYPASDMSLLVYYSLYQINMEEGNEVMANFYKEKIINTYPNSPFAKVLVNPDYAKELEAEQNRANLLYNEAYDLYNQGVYAEVINKANMVLEDYPKHELIPKVAYLKAVSKGKMSGEDAVLREEMKNFVLQYPGSEPVEYANTIINHIDQAKPEIFEAKEEEIAKEIYTYNPDTIHFVVFVVGTQKQMNQLVFNLINYNLDNYQKQQLKTDVKMLEEPTQLISVNSFQSDSEALNYFNNAIASEDVFNDVNGNDVSNFIISAKNYETLLEDKSVSRYLTFFKNYY
jgi:tetratricopeptide (TPR) repeat protein